MIAPGLMPRTIQLCTRCQQNPAGFWVSSSSGQTVRRPWCLACLPELDRGSCHVIPLDSVPRTGPHRRAPTAARHGPLTERQDNQADGSCAGSELFLPAASSSCPVLPALICCRRGPLAADPARDKEQS